MTYQATVTYTKPIIRSAMRQFWFRYIAWHGFAVIAISTIVAAVLIATGDRSWVAGMFAVLSIISLATSTAVYVVLLRRSFWRFNHMHSKSANFTFSDESLTVASDLGKSEMSWRAIKKIWKFPDVWLLFVSKSVFITLPLSDIDASTQEFIAEQTVRHGGRVE